MNIQNTIKRISFAAIFTAALWTMSGSNVQAQGYGGGFGRGFSGGFGSGSAYSGINYGGRGYGNFGGSYNNFGRSYNNFGGSYGSAYGRYNSGYRGSRGYKRESLQPFVLSRFTDRVFGY